MKKVKFTLGLALAMLLVSANFVNAAKEVGYRNDKEAIEKEKTNIGYSFTVISNPQYVSVKSKLTDHSHLNKTQAIWYDWYEFFPRFVDLDVSDGITKKDYSKLICGSAEYYGTKGSSGKTLSYESGTPLFAGSKVNGIHSLYTTSADLYNDIEVKLNYKEGVEVVPVIKRTIVLGEWYYANHDDDKDVHGNEGKGNRMDPTDVVIVDYLRADTVTYRTDHDRGTGIATYVFCQEIRTLFNRFPIFSVSYELSIHDEIGNLGEEAYEPPMMAIPSNMRGLKFEVGGGITTDIPMNIIGNTLYVTSKKNYKFKVFSSKEIDVTSNRSNDPYDGIVVEKDKTQANAYEVTVKGVQSDFTVKIVQKSDSQSGTGEEGTTGNDGAATDAVWGANGTLYVNAATPGAISVYSVTGQLYKKEVVSGSYSLSMPKGLYIIQLNGKAYKVVL